MTNGLFLVIAASLGLVLVEVGSARGPSKDFHTHLEVKVRLRDNFPDEQHLDSLSLEILEATNHTLLFTLDLQLNRDLLPHRYFQKYHKEGQHVIERPRLQPADLCHYKGHIKGQKQHTWAAISTCNSSIHGVFNDGHELWHLHHHHHQESQYFLYQHKDQVSQNFTCGYKDPAPKIRLKRDISSPANSDSRVENGLKTAAAEEDFDGKIAHNVEAAGGGKKPVPAGLRGPWNSDKRSRYVELVLVVDHQEYVEHDKNLELVYRICKDVANVMNALYSPLNIYIALVGVVVWTEFDEIQLSTDGDTTLKNFLHYRKERLVKEHPNDNAQLLTGIQFEGGVVGKALKGPICTYEFSGGVNMWHSDVVGLVATTVAHEMGHNFGMDHDKEECECPDDRCIMAPASSTMKPTFWSSCSLEYLALAFEHGMDYCLRNKPEKLFQSPVCGNSFVEPGEECDCGLKDHCDNPCCNPDTCTLFANATCATGECCDFSTCQPKSPGSICRPAEHECDLPEYCNGATESCPGDVFKVDGIPCKVGTAFCYQGSCRTHSDQCRLLWGPTGKKSENQCYEQNMKGTRHGNCGYDRMNNTYIQCSESDVRCGMLHCQHLNERLEFGTESAAILSHSFINSGGRIIPCRTALVDLGLNDVDPGLAPEGARCGEDSLCVNQKCLPVSSLVIGPSSCPGNCNGHGMCNSEGNCHCDVGFAPPLCDRPGPGGSMNSGPASSSEVEGNSGWFILLYIVLMLVPIFAVIWLLSQRIRRSETGGDWRLLVEKAKLPRKRMSDVEPSNILASEAPAQIAKGGSPTQALLPHVDTSTSALSTVVMSDKVQGEAASSAKASRSGSLFSGIKRPQFMHNLAKSISLPSPKLRAAVKTMATYEIKVEHQQAPREDDDHNIMSSPSSAASNEDIVDGSAKTSSKDSVLFIKEEKVNVQTTTIGSSGGINNMAASKSLTTFGSRPIRSTLKMSSSFRPSTSTEAAEAINTAAVLTTTAKNSCSSLVKEKVKALENSEAAKTTESVVASIIVAASTTSVASSKTSSSSSPTTTPTYCQDPKLAFPHSSSFAGRTSTAFTSKAAVASVGTSQSAHTGLVEVASSAAAASSENVKANKKPPPLPAKPLLPISKPFDKVDDEKSEKTATTTTSTASISPTVLSSPPPNSVTMPFLSKTSTLPPLAVGESKCKPSMPKSSTLPNVPSRPVISRPVLQTATPSAASLISKSHSTGVSQTSILANKAEKGSNEANRASRGVVFCDPLTLPSPTNPNNPPIIHLQPKNATSPQGAQPVLQAPTSVSVVASVVVASPPTPKSATSPVTATVTKPIEAKAVIVSSVITPTWSTEPKAVTSNIVLCNIDDTDSGSEVGSPKKNSAAPIISPESDKVVVEAKSSKGSSLSKLKSKLVKRSQSEKKERRPSKDQQQQSFDTSSGLSSPTSSVRSNEPPPQRPERGHLTKLDISGPILQSVVVDVSKANLLPVCRSHDATPTETEAKTTSAASTEVTKISPSHHKKAKAPLPPPVVPRRSPATAKPEDLAVGHVKKASSKRPASIATTRPSRPSAPPPRPPPQRPNVGGSPTRSETSSVASYDSTASTSTLKDEIKAITASPLTSPLSLDDFDTPLSSPILARRSPDAVSTTSSSDGDLMREILKDLDSEVKEEVSTLMRKKNKNKKPIVYED